MRGINCMNSNRLKYCYRVKSYTIIAFNSNSYYNKFNYRKKISTIYVKHDKMIGDLHSM